jgi:uncharacterized membrane protein required for colicin V production
MAPIDFVVIGLWLILATVQSRRGFLQSALDLVAGLVAAGITRGVAAKMEGMGGPLAVFFVILAGLLVASFYIYNLTAFTIEAYDPLLGVIFGFALACVIAYVIYWAGDGARLGEPTPEWILDSTLAGGFYYYNWWHSFQDFMAGLGETPS